MAGRLFPDNTASMTPTVNSPSTLPEWLQHCERLHPHTIDMGLERVKTVATRMGLRFDCPVITVAGTNGKGSTCAMLEAVLLQAGYRTGVYTSPHLVQFEERCRVNGESVSASDLIASFAVVEAQRLQKDAQAGQADISLTYFEFSTLAILRLMSQAALDVVILEVGLGGRLDAVNIIDADCAVITSIDLDHMEFLGPDREAIGLEKAGIMRAGRPVIVSDPVPPQSVVDHAARVGADLWCFGRDFNYSGDKQQWGWGGRQKRFSGLAYPALRGANQLVNASGVLAALEALRERIPVTAQAVRNGLAMVSLPGRFQIVPGEPVLVLDVAHNPHAVAALTANLDAMGFYPCTHAVLGAMADKDLPTMLARIAPLVDRWYCCDLPLPRAASGQHLADVLGQVKAGTAALAGGPSPEAVSVHADPASALAAAVAAAAPTDRIVVFGSFLTVGGVLKDGIPRLHAKHLNGA